MKAKVLILTCMMEKTIGGNMLPLGKFLSSRLVFNMYQLNRFNHRFHYQLTANISLFTIHNMLYGKNFLRSLPMRMRIVSNRAVKITMT